MHSTTPMRTHQHQYTHTHTTCVCITYAKMYVHMYVRMYACANGCNTHTTMHTHMHGRPHRTQVTLNYTYYNAMFQTHSTTDDSTCCLCTRRLTHLLHKSQTHKMHYTSHKVPYTSHKVPYTSHKVPYTLHRAILHTNIRMSHVTDTCLSWQTSPLAPISAT